MAIVLSVDPAMAQVGAAPTATREPAAGNWIFSETVSPVDYAPVVIASAWSNAGPDGPAMQLSIQCRRGRTDLVILSAAPTGRPGGHRVFYILNGGPAMRLAVGVAASGTGLAVQDDVVRLLTALPSDGEIAFQITAAQGNTVEGRYALGPLHAVLSRMAEPCKWTAPRSRKAQPQ